MVTQQQQQQANPVSKKTIFELNPIPFESTIQSDFTDTHSFCKQIIYPVFSKIWPDFYGSKIEILQNRFIALSFYFAEPDYPDPNSDKVKMLELISDQDPKFMSINDKIRKANKEQSNEPPRRYKLSEKGKEMLEVMVPTQNRKINWKSITTEGNMNAYQGVYGLNMGRGEGRPYIRVMMDLRKVMRVVFGDKDPKTNEAYEYTTILGNPINPARTQDGGLIVKNWQLILVRGSKRQVDLLAEKYGLSTDALDVVRGSN